MTEKQPENESKPVELESPLQVEDLVRFLLRLAGLHKDSRIGNPELSKGLQAVANALKPHSNKLLKELTEILPDNFMSTADKGKTKQPRIELPPDLKSLNEDAIFAILQNEEYTKLQLIDLGVQRFGISRSKLMRSSKESVSDSIRAALNHETSLGIISQEARRGGENRTS